MADFTLLELLPYFNKIENDDIGWQTFGPRILTPGGHISLLHCAFGVLAAVIILAGAIIARQKYDDPKEALVPDKGITVRNLFESMMEAVYTMMEGMMGRKNTEKYFMLISGLAFFIFVSNLMGLVPGLFPPTSNFNTNLACSLVVFVVYNIAGIREHGFINYFKHFLGPSAALAILILPIELVSHIVRPISLAIRPTGNVGGDHLVLSIFSDLAAQVFSAIGGLFGIEHFDFPFLIPLPFYFLGLLVSVIQATVFCLLSSVYIALAAAHDSH